MRFRHASADRAVRAAALALLGAGLLAGCAVDTRLLDEATLPAPDWTAPVATADARGTPTSNVPASARSGAWQAPDARVSLPLETAGLTRVTVRGTTVGGMASGSLERTLAARAGSVCPNGYREVSRLPIAGADRLSDTTYRVTIICN